MVSASSRDRQSGGAKPMISPCGMARAMTPRLSMAGDGWPDFPGWIEEDAVVAVLDQLDGAEHAFAAHVTDILVLANCVSHALVEIGAGISGIGDEAKAVNELEVGDTCRRTDRVSRVGPAVADGPNSSVPCSRPARPFWK
jgi:hypothetical protein